MRTLMKPKPLSVANVSDAMEFITKVALQWNLFEGIPNITQNRSTERTRHGECENRSCKENDGGMSGEAETLSNDALSSSLNKSVKSEELRYLARTLVSHIRIGAVRTTILIALRCENAVDLNYVGTDKLY